MSDTARLEVMRRYLQAPAVLTIDVHRGHLDPEVATLPVPADVAARVTADINAFLNAARSRRVPVVHVVTSYRHRDEIVSNPFWRYKNTEKGSTRSNIDRHNLSGSPGVELMPGTLAPGDRVVDCKKRYDCFHETDLDLTLRALGVRSLALVGVNTNSCVLATAIAANVRDYAVFVVREGVDSMDGPEAHSTGLRAVELAFGWVVSAAEILEILGPG